MRKFGGVLSLVLLLAWSGASDARTVTHARAEDQTSLNVVIYDAGLALVTEVRTVKIPKGSGELRFAGVASAIRPNSVHVAALEDPHTLAFLEQGFLNGKVEAATLLKRYEGKKIKIVQRSGSGDTQQTWEATVVDSAGDGVFDINGEIFLGHPGIKVLPGMPEDLITGPTLIWRFANTGAVTRDIELSYVTRGVDWSTRYVLILGPEEKRANMLGRLRIHNQSGVDFNEADITVLQQKPREGPQSESVVLRPGANDRSNAMPGQNMALQQAYPYQGRQQAQSQHPPNDSPAGAWPSQAEYYPYPLPHKTTLKNGRDKMIRFLAAPAVTVEKRYEVRSVSEAEIQAQVGANSGYYPQGTRNLPLSPSRGLSSNKNPWLGEATGGKFSHAALEQRKAVLKDFFTKRFVTRDPAWPVRISLNLANVKAQGLGVPLPAGTVRLYRETEDGARRVVGMSSLGHVDEDGAVKFSLGNARKVSATRIQTDYRSITNRVHETEWEITLRNEKDRAVTITVVEPLFGQWEVIESSHAFKEVDPFTIAFEVNVPANEETRLRYRLSLGL